jgi:alkanesulfonate monooxygenase SsuD/methylene tetrahydromethanopterin reductase-like flavin-dependent oxidoreductase (luciferase family)
VNQPVLTIDLPTSPDRLAQLPTLAAAFEQAGAGALSLSGDAESGDLHPIHVAASLAPVTTTLGLIPRTDAVDVEPFHLATQLAALDNVSHGRAGWLIEARTDAAAAEAVGLEVLDQAATAQEVADVLVTARLVWDSWADDAVVRDTDSGRYLDASRLQYVDHQADRFFVRGPSITPRSPQGLLPVLVADQDRTSVGEKAGALADGRALDVDLTGPSGRADEDHASETIAAAVREALASAAGPVGLVRLTGAVPDPAAVAEAVRSLRAEGLIAPAPRDGRTLRDQLGLPRPETRIDPERRADRARTVVPETATPELQETR